MSPEPIAATREDRFWDGARRLADRCGDSLRVARFLRGLRAYRARADDVFISSYPRSGTTWMQLIVHLLRGGDASFGHISHVVPWFERSLALGRLSAADLGRIAAPRTFKSHLPHAWLPRGARYLYVHRDGRDVVVSYYHFYRSHLGFVGSFDDFFARFMRGDLQYRSWFDHVADWQRAARRNPAVCVVAYEDLLRDPERTLRAVAAACGTSPSPGRIREVLELASFDAMKRAEDKFDHAAGEPDSAAPRGRFVRRGEAGAHFEVLRDVQRAAFARRLAAPRVRRLPELRLAAFLH